jgi:hypothetical protein
LSIVLFKYLSIFDSIKIKIMKKYCLLFSLLMGICNFSFAQKSQKAAKSVYAELLGAGIVSLNYDMRIFNREDGLGFRAGVGGISINITSGFSSERIGITTIPLELNYLLGKDNRNYFEVGAGGTIVTLRQRNSNSVISDSRFTSSFGHLYFGYRKQPIDGGFLFRAGITPLFNRDGFFPLWAGISFGYKF